MQQMREGGLAEAGFARFAPVGGKGGGTATED